MTRRFATATAILVIACGAPSPPPPPPRPPVAPPAPLPTACDDKRTAALALLAQGRLERGLASLEAFASDCPAEVSRIAAARVTALGEIGRRVDALQLAAILDALPNMDDVRRAGDAVRAEPPRPTTNVDWPKSIALEDQGYALLARGDAKTALARFETACQLRAECTRSMIGSALALRALGDGPRAQKLLDRALWAAETANEGRRGRMEIGPSFAERGRFVAAPSRSRWAFVSQTGVSLLDGPTLREEMHVAAPPHLGRVPGRLEDRVCVGSCSAGAFSPDSTLFVWARTGQSVWLWDLATGAATTLANTAGLEPMEIAFSPDGRVMAVNLADGVGLWDMTTRVRMRTVAGATPFAFAPDGVRITTSRGVFEVATGKAISPLDLATTDVRVIAPDGSWIVAGSRAPTGVARLHRVARAPVTLPKIDRFRIAASPDGTRIATAPVMGPAKLWDLEPFHEVASWSPGVSYEGIGFSPKGTFVASWGKPTTVDLWDPKTRTTTATLKPGGHSDKSYVEDVVFSHDESIVLTDTRGPDEIQVWDPVTGKELPQAASCCLARTCYAFELCEDRFRR